MADHYYSRNPNTASEPMFWNAELRHHQFRFKTDQGVFSKKEVDFGSRFLIEVFEMPILDGNVLDIGCGYGPIGLSLAKDLPDRLIHMVDVNQRAIGLAKENAELNGIDNVEIYESDRFTGITGDKFCSNINQSPHKSGEARCA